MTDTPTPPARSTEPGDFQRVSLEDARDLIDERDAIVLDIRDEASFAAGRIDGARPFDAGRATTFLAARQADERADASRPPVIVCCYHGHSSQQAAAWLAAQGAGEVYSLDGGFTGWSARFPDDIDAGD